MKHSINKSQRINFIAGMYLSEQEEGTIIDAYDKLKEVFCNLNQYKDASNYVTLWQPLEGSTVETILNLIDTGVEQLEEIIISHGGKLD